MKFAQLSKDEQVTHLRNEIHNWEQQYLQQLAYAEAAAAAATTEAPAGAEGDEATKFEKQRAQYGVTEREHRFTAKECENRANAVKALLAQVEGAGTPTAEKKDAPAAQ